MMFRACRAGLSKFGAMSPTSQMGTRRFQTQTGPLREYFILVWDRPGAERRHIRQTDLVPPFCTFAGECLNPDPTMQPEVRGNGFACLAHSVEEVQEKMKASVYYKQKIWDLSTASITPLMTVHTSDYEAQSVDDALPTPHHRSDAVEAAASHG